jgi:hypothetical protein
MAFLRTTLAPPLDPATTTCSTPLTAVPLILSAAVTTAFLIPGMSAAVVPIATGLD